ncbi:MAG TPA: hypothetical protein VJT72_19455 [Pseudonocardiaceae bacterium]|nr:hypothetical protein [Pseudonocardiaceae bacterium]
MLDNAEVAWFRWIVGTRFCFFRTHRITLCRRGFVVQLALVMADLDRRGLYYDDSPLSGGMTGAHGDRVARLA